MEVIASIKYVILGNWGLVAPTIVSKFLQDGHPFLLGVMGVNNSSPLPL
jgi:hypothetical protein